MPTVPAEALVVLTEPTTGLLAENVPLASDSTAEITLPAPKFGPPAV